MRNITGALVVAVLLGSAPAVCQGKAGKDKPGKEKPAPKSRDPELAKSLFRFKKLIGSGKKGKGDKGKKAKGDNAAIAILDGLLVRFPDLHPRDRQAFAKAVGGVLTKQRPRPMESRQRLFERCVVALGKMGKLGAHALVEGYDHDKFGKREWIGLRAKMLEQVGRTGAVSQRGFLVSQVRSAPDDRLLAAAGSALGEFASAPQKDRKEISKDLIGRFVEIQEASLDMSQGQEHRATFARRFEAVRDPWNEALRKLTGQTFRNPQEWQKFRNSKGFKKDDWDKARKTERSGKSKGRRRSLWKQRQRKFR